MLGGILYKRSFNQMLLRCLDEDEAAKVMIEIHEGCCGPHMSGFMLAKNLMRQGYFWLTMERDCHEYVKRCFKCQEYGNLIHSPASELHNLTSPWPFAIWGMDIIRKISPKSTNGHEYILVAVDYFTKWIEATSLKQTRGGSPKTFVLGLLVSIRSNGILEISAPFKRWKKKLTYSYILTKMEDEKKKNLSTFIKTLFSAIKVYLALSSFSCSFHDSEKEIKSFFSNGGNHIYK